MGLATAQLTQEQRDRAEVLLVFSENLDSPEERLEREARAEPDFASLAGRRVA